VSKEGGHGSGLNCPKCGAELLVQGETVWCSLVAGDTTKGCDWGIGERRTLAGLFKDRGLYHPVAFAELQERFMAEIRINHKRLTALEQVISETTESEQATDQGQAEKAGVLVHREEDTDQLWQSVPMGQPGQEKEEMSDRVKIILLLSWGLFLLSAIVVIWRAW